jgi:hypothetical protein
MPASTIKFITDDLFRFGKLVIRFFCNYRKFWGEVVKFVDFANGDNSRARRIFGYKPNG